MIKKFYQALNQFLTINPFMINNYFALSLSLSLLLIKGGLWGTRQTTFVMGKEISMLVFNKMTFYFSNIIQLKNKLLFWLNILSLHAIVSLI